MHHCLNADCPGTCNSAHPTWLLDPPAWFHSQVLNGMVEVSFEEIRLSFINSPATFFNNWDNLYMNNYFCITDKLNSINKPISMSSRYYDLRRNNNPNMFNKEKFFELKRERTGRIEVERTIDKEGYGFRKYSDKKFDSTDRKSERYDTSERKGGRYDYSDRKSERYDSSDRRKYNYDSKKPYYDDSKKSYYDDKRKPYDDKRTFYDNKKSYYDDNKKSYYDDRRGNYENKRYYDNKSYDNKRQYDTRKEGYDIKRSYDNRRSYDDNRRTYDSRRSYDNRSYEGKKSYYSDKKEKTDLLEKKDEEKIFKDFVSEDEL